MAQVTEEFVRQMLVHCERKEHPPLTVWEAEQLARAWLDLQALRMTNEAMVYLQVPQPLHDVDEELNLMANLEFVMGRAMEVLTQGAQIRVASWFYSRYGSCLTSLDAGKGA